MARRRDIPLAMASTSMKLIGMNSAMKNKKAEMVSRTNRRSVKGSQNTRSSSLRGLCGRRDFTVKSATRSNARIRKAHIRIVHP